MKKKIILGLAILAIAVVAAFNVNLNMSQKSELSLLALANVEALAQNESNPVVITCNQYCSGMSKCWNFDWGYNNMSYKCYFTGYMYHSCYC